MIWLNWFSPAFSFSSRPHPPFFLKRREEIAPDVFADSCLGWGWVSTPTAADLEVFATPWAGCVRPVPGSEFGRRKKRSCPPPKDGGSCCVRTPPCDPQTHRPHLHLPEGAFGKLRSLLFSEGWWKGKASYRGVQVFIVEKKGLVLCTGHLGWSGLEREFICSTLDAGVESLLSW